MFDFDHAFHWIMLTEDWFCLCLGYFATSSIRIVIVLLSFLIGFGEFSLFETGSRKRCKYCMQLLSVPLIDTCYASLFSFYIILTFLISFGLIA